MMEIAPARVNVRIEYPSVLAVTPKRMVYRILDHATSERLYGPDRVITSP